MVSRIVTDEQLFDLTISFGHLDPYVLVKEIKMLLDFCFAHATLRIVGWVLIHIGHDYGLTESGLDVFSRAFVTVPTGTNLEKEGTVDSMSARLVV